MQQPNCLPRFRDLTRPDWMSCPLQMWLQQQLHLLPKAESEAELVPFHPDHHSEFSANYCD
jgi:hypothetical protein